MYKNFTKFEMQPQKGNSNNESKNVYLVRSKNLTFIFKFCPQSNFSYHALLPPPTHTFYQDEAHSKRP